MGIARRSVEAAVFATTAALCGCVTLGPDYQEPQVAWLQDWQTDLYGQVAQSPSQQTQVDLRFWWEAFNDPVLNGLIDTARHENPTLRIAGLRILESRAVLGIAGASVYPQVQQLSGAASYVDQKRSGGNLPDNDQHFAAYSFGFDLGWELDFWGRFRRSIESAEAGFFASITNQQDAQVLLSAQVASLYYGYRTTLLRIDIARKNAAIQKRSLEITQRLFEDGQESELDLQQAKSQYLGTLALIPALEADQVKLRNALAALLGRMPGDVPELAAQDKPLPVVGSAVITAFPANLLLRRRDVRTAAWQVAAQSAQIGIAKADYFPAITLLGTIGWSTSTQDGAPTIRTFGFGPALTWPIFDYGRIRNNVRLQDARLQEAIEGFQNTTLLAAQEMDDAAIDVVKTAEQQTPLSGAARAAERSLDLANTQYKEGYAGFDRVLDAQRVMFAQVEAELLNQSAHVSAVITMYKAVGGGWTDMPMDAMVPEPVRAQMQARTNWGDLLTAPLPASASAPAEAADTTGKPK
jgi:NodT family efflux transporter outer membrane factor (OMF) lipoprotein